MNRLIKVCTLLVGITVSTSQALPDRDAELINVLLPVVVMFAGYFESMPQEILYPVIINKVEYIDTSAVQTLSFSANLLRFFQSMCLLRFCTQSYHEFVDLSWAPLMLMGFHAWRVYKSYQAFQHSILPGNRYKTFQKKSDLRIYFILYIKFMILYSRVCISLVTSFEAVQYFLFSQLALAAYEEFTLYGPHSKKEYAAWIAFLGLYAYHKDTLMYKQDYSSRFNNRNRSYEPTPGLTLSDDPDDRVESANPCVL